MGCRTRPLLRPDVQRSCQWWGREEGLQISPFLASEIVKPRSRPSWRARSVEPTAWHRPAGGAVPGQR